MSSASASALNIGLRNGATCVLSGGALTIGETSFPLTALASAALVADMSAPVAPGMPPAPAVALRLGDGASYYLTPIEQGDAVRLLQAIHAARPDLAAATNAPPPGYGPGYGPAYGAGYGPAYGAGYGPAYGAGYGPGYAGYSTGYMPPQPGYYGAQAGAYPPPPPGYAPYGQTDSDRTLAGICHLSVFFAPIILPLIVWLAMRQSHPYASQQAKQAFWFHLLMGILTAVVITGAQFIFFSIFFSTVATQDPSTLDPTAGLAPFGFIIVIWGAALVVGLINAIFSVIAAVKAFKGEPYHYPLLGWL